MKLRITETKQESIYGEEILYRLQKKGFFGWKTLKEDKDLQYITERYNAIIPLLPAKWESKTEWHKKINGSLYLLIETRDTNREHPGGKFHKSFYELYKNKKRIKRFNRHIDAMEWIEKKLKKLIHETVITLYTEYNDSSLDKCIVGQ